MKDRQMSEIIEDMIDLKIKGSTPTLRDQFAIGALNSFRHIYSVWAIENDFNKYAKYIAEQVYIVADAMLKQREVGNE